MLFALIEKNILIYVIKRGMGPPPRTLTTFERPLGGTIFLLDHPSDLRGGGRFNFYHELGHVSAVAKYPQLQTWLGMYPFLAVSSWHYTETMWPSGAAIASILYLIGIVIFTLLYWSPLAYRSRGFHEELADTFALAHLDLADQQRAARSLRKYPPSIAASRPTRAQRKSGDLKKGERMMHRDRLRLLRQNLGLVEQGKAHDLPPPPMLKIVLMHVPERIMLAASVALAWFALPYHNGHVAFLVELVGALMFFRYLGKRLERKNEHRIRQMMT